ncbi:MAG: hypothetical protein JNK25_06305 [Phycisphaerae bacterium]|nr:hypothetical protein [Phycisphaerae bacterium]
MNRTFALSLSSLVLSSGFAFAGGTPDSGTIPDGGFDNSLVRELHINAYMRAWESGLPIADVDGSGGVDGDDIEAFYRALAADVNGDGTLNKYDIIPMFAVWSEGGAAGDLNFDGGVDGADLEAFFTALEQFTLPSVEELSKSVEAEPRDPKGGPDKHEATLTDE